MEQASGMTISSVAEEILDEVKIPSLPEAAVQLVALCHDDQVGAAEIVRIVELDPALSARLLKMANSSYYGQQHRVSTLSRAAVVLGNEQLKSVALGFYLAGGWRAMGHAGFDLHEFWRDSIVRGCLCRQLARSMELHPAEQAFLVGILGDLGTLILLTRFGSAYLAVCNEGRDDFVRRRQVEQSAFGTDHAELAGALAIRWNFPDLLVSAMGRRCRVPPMMPTRDPSVLLWQLAYFCAAVPFAMDRQTARLTSSLRALAVAAFGLSFEALGEVFTDSVEQYNVLRLVFADLSPADCDADKLMAEAGKLMASIDPLSQ